MKMMKNIQKNKLTKEERKEKRKFSNYFKFCKSPEQTKKYLPSYWYKLRPREKERWILENVPEQIQYKFLEGGKDSTKDNKKE